MVASDQSSLINNFQQQTLSNTSSMTKAATRVLRNAASSRGAGGIHRSAYYNIVKGGSTATGCVKKQATQEVICYFFSSFFV